VVWWCGGVVVWWSAGVLVCRSVANSARQRRPAGAGDERRGCQREGDGEAVCVTVVEDRPDVELTSLSLYLRLAFFNAC
jgi:hypothetical protein